MLAPDLKKITVDTIPDHFLKSRNVQADVLRLDKMHPVISGNKWFKLKYHLDNFDAGNYNGIVTFGGAWSNHIVAAACACHLKKIACVGVIRGEKPSRLSATLLEAISYGMELRFISRASYKSKDDGETSDLITKEFQGFYTIPEGGAGADGEKGAAEIMNLLPGNDYSHIICAVGTGTMFNGIYKAVLPEQYVIGIRVLRGSPEIRDADRRSIYNYDFGGYAKYTNELLAFMNVFYQQTRIPTDFVYTGKLAFAIFDLVKKEHFPKGSRIFMIHSGGLQGNASLQKGSLIF